MVTSQRCVTEHTGQTWQKVNKHEERYVGRGDATCPMFKLNS